MRILIIKLGATGDVVRTTPLLHILDGQVDWLTSDSNTFMLQDLPGIKNIIPWNNAADLVKQTYDLVINLEDTEQVGELVNKIQYKQIFGAYLDQSGNLVYTDDSSGWFDLSLISKFGKVRADQLKLENRKSYQELVFEGLGHKFRGEKYLLPPAIKTDLKGDIAISDKAGSVWPMKNWPCFKELKLMLEKEGYRVNILPLRNSLLEHIGDVQNHRYLISGDSLPMHIGLGKNMKCLSIFICTSPWEIYDYGLQRKIISPLLHKYFYERGFYKEAVSSISLEKVFREFQYLTKAT